MNEPEPAVELPLLPPHVPEITLEEWIAATQACCGVDHPEDDDEAPSPNLTSPFGLG